MSGSSWAQFALLVAALAISIPILGTYLARFDEGLPNRFVGLTGTRAEVEAAQEAAGVPLAEGEGTMHATSLYLFGNDDLARVVFSAGDTAQEITQDLNVIATA